jgi:hypothetical protein
MLKIIFWSVLIYLAISIYLLFKRGKIIAKKTSGTSTNNKFDNLDIKDAEYEDLDE